MRNLSHGTNSEPRSSNSFFSLLKWYSSLPLTCIIWTRSGSIIQCKNAPKISKKWKLLFLQKCHELLSHGCDIHQFAHSVNICCKLDLETELWINCTKANISSGHLCNDVTWPTRGVWSVIAYTLTCPAPRYEYWFYTICMQVGIITTHQLP